MFFDLGWRGRVGGVGRAPPTSTSPVIPPLTCLQLLRLKEENALSKSQLEELHQKLTQTRKMLVARDLHVKELEDTENELAGRLQELEQELRQVREKDQVAQSLLNVETELNQTKQEKERLAVDLEKAKKV